MINDEKWVCFATDKSRWYVTHSLIQKKWYEQFGPFDTEEEAYRVSGMPRPKTELEEVWELVDHLSGKIAEHVGGYIPHFTRDNALTKVKELKAKWKK